MSKASRTNSAELEPLVLLEDEPVENWEQDELGLLDFSRIIAATALGTRGPFTIGVYGAWGEGKTSVLKQAQTLLDRESGNRDNIVTVWFNAWQFEHEEHPIVPLVASIVDQIEKTLTERKSLAQKDRATVAGAFKKMRDALRSVAYGFSYGGFKAKDMIDRYEQLQKSGEPVRDRSLYYNAYEALAKAVPHEIRKGDINAMPHIVVFIDDLDRCLPARAVRLLESIKLVLTQPGFIFALAVYKPVIQAYIDAETNRQLQGINIAHRGVEYLDKIIQLALPLPSHESRFVKYVEDLLKREMFKSGANASLKKIVVELKDVLAQGVRHNPRSLVRLINNLIVDRALYLAVNRDAKDQDKVIGVFAVSRILQTQIRDEDVYDHLVTHQDVCRRILDAKGVAELRRSERTREQKSQTDPEQYGEQLTKRLLVTLDRASNLFDLLKSEPGRKWLSDDDLRKRITQFLAATRKDSPQETIIEPRSQEDIVDRAIRNSLKLGLNETITDNDRKSAKSIFLAHSNLSDTGLSYVAKLPALTTLNLWDTHISDEGLQHLARLTSLRTLILSETQVTDSGLKCLADMRTLSRLDLWKTDVTDAGLEHLQGLRKLTWLDLTETNVTDVKIEWLKNALPECKIHW